MIYEGGVEALQDITLDFPAGQLTTLLGPSRLRQDHAAQDHRRPDRGRAAAACWSMARRSTGPGPERAFVFQDFALMPWATVMRNVAFGLELRGVAKAEREDGGAEIYRRGRPHGLRGQLSARAVRRHAAAGRPGPRAGGRRRRAADGRALLGRRRADPPQVPGRSAAAGGAASARHSSSSRTRSRRRSMSPTGSCCCRNGRAGSAGIIEPDIDRSVDPERDPPRARPISIRSRRSGRASSTTSSRVPGMTRHAIGVQGSALASLMVWAMLWEIVGRSGCELRLAAALGHLCQRHRDRPDADLSARPFRSPARHS